MKRELQRDRPPPLMVNRPETRIPRRRPLMVVQTQALQYRQPLIIHTFSPEVIQTEAHDFMSLVQRLTGQSSHVSPLAKRPRRVLETQHASVIPRPVAISLTEQLPDPLMSTVASRTDPLMPHPQEQQRNAAEFGLRRCVSPAGVLSQTSLPPLDRRGAGGISALSPASFEFSPSMLLSPTTFLRDTFLRDFPSLSPYAAGLPSPSLSRSPGMMLPAALRSPGPLTSTFLADLPVLSPAAYKWIERHPLSAETVLSPLPSTLGLPPRPPPAHG